MIATWRISQSIYRPIKKLHDVTNTITRVDLRALMNRDNVDEITELCMSFNIMVGWIRELLDAKLQEQENLRKAELRALQAQINPHFLYNTLDTIVWMAESKKTDDIVELVSALSNFFRISLSKGQRLDYAWRRSRTDSQLSHDSEDALLGHLALPVNN